jgi:polysaccharide export outer membrane protein
VFNVPELSKLVVRVANDGNISLPLIGQVLAAGMTAERLRSELEKRFGESYLESPQISLYVQEFHARPVSVIGAVERPGLYQLTGPRSLIELLSMAGGLAKRGTAPAGRFVYVTRVEGFGDLGGVEGMRRVAPDKLEIDIRRLLYSHEDALNIEVKPRDIISVNKADIVYVTGNGAKRPGGYVLEDRDNVTIMQALAMAEGLSSNAAQADAHIIRTEPDGSKKMIPVNLKKILKGNSPDLLLADNDILFIPDSTQKAMLKGGAATVVSTLSLLFVYGRI